MILRCIHIGPVDCKIDGWFSRVRYLMARLLLVRGSKCIMVIYRLLLWFIVWLN